MAKSLKWRSKRRETPDLPPELWLEILSYLPDIYLRKMMGVSRTLYALALPEIFRELDLLNDDPATIQQLDSWLK